MSEDAHVRCAAQTPLAPSPDAPAAPPSESLCECREVNATPRVPLNIGPCVSLCADGLEVKENVEGSRAARDGSPWRCYGPMLTHSRSDGDFPIYTRGERRAYPDPLSLELKVLGTPNISISASTCLLPSMLNT